MYTLLVEQLKALSEGVDWWVTQLSNASALLYSSMENVNWAGFYLLRDGVLQLGPFQGKTACTKITVGKGVCGTAVETNGTIRVEDVHQFPGHIACDSASRSEIVIPIRKHGDIIGVLDIDSPNCQRFTKEDEEGLTQFVRALEEIIEL